MECRTIAMKAPVFLQSKKTGNTWRKLREAVIFCLVLVVSLGATDGYSEETGKGESSSAEKRVAIIGGGVAGTFASKYLTDYDDDCALASVDIIDPNPISQYTPLNHNKNIEEAGADYWQGSRVASIQLGDGSLVELGASIAYKGFLHFLEMMAGDDTLEEGKPFYTGKETGSLNTGFGIYNGKGHFSLLTSNSTPLWSKLKMFYRYNVDFIRLSRAASTTEASFSQLFEQLKRQDEETYFESPDAMWDAVGLLHLTRMSFDEYLDSIGVLRELSWWRKYLPYQGSLRDELVAAFNFCNYNQDNSQLNALVGLGSFATVKGGLFSIVGGNHKILGSAVAQANMNHKAKCGSKHVVQHVQERVSSVVGGLDRPLQVYGASGDLLGDYDVVILAAPIQQARISFLVESHMDGAVLQPMPLNGMIDADSEDHDPPKEGHNVLPDPLPSFATRTYTSVVTTVVSGVNMEALAQHFSLSVTSLPRSILATEKGKAAENNITAITQLSSTVYKMFSTNQLDEKTLLDLFGKGIVVEHVQIWGGPHGGATPDYQGEGLSMNYQLYDAAQGLDGHRSGALYYANAIESSFACMELSAIGAKSVAKLAARKLELVRPMKTEFHSDEL